MSRRPRDTRLAAERLHSAAIHLLRAVRKVDSAMGLGPAKSSALSVLVFGGPRSLGELAAAEGVKPPSMTRIVQELVAAGHVRRAIDKADRRAVRLEATAQGTRILNEGRSRRAALLAEWLGQLNQAEFETIQTALPALERISVFSSQVHSTRTREYGGKGPGSTGGQEH